MKWFKLLDKYHRYEKAALQYSEAVASINALSDEMRQLPDKELKQRVREYYGQSTQAVIDHKIEIFAAVREAAERTIKMRHFDVQIMGGLALLDGKIAEMKTGEGKTLVATLPLVLHGLTEKGAHLVTVNEYLAARDAEWMRPIYEFFGLTVGVLRHGQTAAEKRAAYFANITYGTNNEFGFDYLRDNMAQSEAEMVQQPLNYAIVDEVDSILIDEARTPLIISAPDTDSTILYSQFAQLVPRLQAEVDYNIDEKRRAAMLTDKGTSKVEKTLGVDNIYEEKGIRFVHHLEQALRAHTLYQRDKDYVVKDGQVVIVDEFTGRLMEGRRYSEGLHQAIEAKEGVKVQQESRTLATITFQNLFRLYTRLAGMTGTAVTSAEEFEKVYNLDVVAVPTNMTLIRHDRPDRIYINEQAKFAAVVQTIKEKNEAGQPVLVGTIAIEKSEYLSQLLNREGIKHEVLNAKQHAREAEIIAAAGQRAAVTISTNMAGRGTDIKLGETVDELGGLFVLGTERHEARRIDNQLRGRSGRQGDRGETQFYVSLEDDVMRIFGGSKIKGLMTRLRFPENEPIENKMVTKAIDSAQERVEGYYFDMRKQVLSYDDVLNRQRSAIYKLRRGVISSNVWREGKEKEEKIHDHMKALIEDQVNKLILTHTNDGDSNNWNTDEVGESIAALTGLNANDLKSAYKDLLQKEGGQRPDNIKDKLTEQALKTCLDFWAGRIARFGEEVIMQLEKAVVLRAIDMHWMDHLDAMDYLRTGIGLRGYGQRDPLVEYQRESYQMFQGLLSTIRASVVEVVLRAQPSFATAEQTALPAEQQETGAQEGSSLHKLARQGTTAEDKTGMPTIEGKSSEVKTIKGAARVGRNDPCPCGSGKKYKKCHGK
jgi:preprotein translocase subunit SecA